MRWVEACREVGRVAAERVARGMDEASRMRDIVWLTCLRGKRDAIIGLERRIGAERMALTGPNAERATARVRLHCARIHQFVAEAQRCI